MLKKLSIVLLLLSFNASALELTYGKGNFNFNFGLKNLMSYDVTLDVDVYSLKETHLSISNNFYIYGNIDVYKSKTMDDYASYIDKASDFAPLGISISDIASTTGMPTPVSFKMRGIDMSIGLGYDVLRDAKNYLGVGIGTGFCMPYMETHNLSDDIDGVIDMLDYTKTSIMSYKLMPSVEGRYELVDGLYVEALLSFGYQYGSLSNDYINGDANFSGSVIQSDIALSYLWSSLVFDLGYRYSNWDVGEMDVSIAYPSVGFNFAQVLDVGFSSSYLYVGAGWRF